MLLKAGTPLKIVNVENPNFVLDWFPTSGEPLLVCKRDNGHDTQKWILTSLSDGWAIKNQSNGLYIGYNEGAQNGRSLALRDERVLWLLPNGTNEDIHKIVVSGYPMPFAIELLGHNKGGDENAKDGAAVALWLLEQCESRQEWKFVAP